MPGGLGGPFLPACLTWATCCLVWKTRCFSAQETRHAHRTTGDAGGLTQSPPFPTMGFCSFEASSLSPHIRTASLSSGVPVMLGCRLCPFPTPGRPPFASVPTFSHPHTRNDQVAVIFLKAAGCEIAWKTHTELLQGLTLSCSLGW